MNREPTETNPGEVLVCGDCGRVNPVPKGLTRMTAVRCSGCGVLLAGERQRKVSVHCPKCEIRLEIEANWLGQMVACGNCGGEFVAERPQDRAIPAAHKSRDELAPEGTINGVGVAEILDEAEEVAKSRHSKVRRTRKRKRIHKKTVMEILRAGGATLLTLGLVVGIIVEVGRRSEWWLVPPVEPTPGEEAQMKTLQVKPPEMTSEDSKAIDQVLGVFFVAETPEDALAVCRFQGEVGERMRAKSGTAAVARQPEGMRITAQHAEGARLFLRLSGNVQGEANTPLSVVLERPAPGKFLVDWDSYVRFSSEPWLNFTVKREEKVGRFQLRLKRYFAGNVEYPIEEWTSFLVFWHDETDAVNLFVRTDSPECESLLAASEPDLKVPPIEEVRGEGGYFPVTLEVFFPAKTNQPGMPPALELKKFCHSGWVDLREG